MKIALIPSDNGLGHLRRIILLSNFLCKFFKITLFAEKKKISIFNLNKKTKVKNLLIKFKLSKSNGYNSAWSKKFKKNYKYDYYISDNLPEIIAYKKNLVIFANFFWHKELNLKQKRFLKFEKIIKEKKIVTMGNYLFQAKYFKKFNNFKIPFFGFYKKNLKKNSILISFGSSSYKDIESIKKKLDNIILKKKFFFDIPIYLDPKFYKEDYKKSRIFKANYSDKMYNKICVAMIKPGLGTIEECLKRGIPIISYIKNTYSEFKFNSKILVLNKLGFEFDNFENAIYFTKKIFKNKKRQKFFEKNCQNLKWNGERIVKKILIQNRCKSLL